MVHEKFWVKNFCVQKNFGQYFKSKNVLVKQFISPNKFLGAAKNFRSKKFDQNWNINSRDIPDMHKYHQGKSCLHKCHHDS